MPSSRLLARVIKRLWPAWALPLACSGVLLTACAQQHANEAPAAATQAPPPPAAAAPAPAAPEPAEAPEKLSSAKDEAAAETLEQAEAALEQAKAEIDRLAFAEPKGSMGAGSDGRASPAARSREARGTLDKKAAPAAAPKPSAPGQNAQAESEAGELKQENACETGCKALASLLRAKAAVCRLDAPGGARCSRAEGIARAAEARVASCACPH